MGLTLNEYESLLRTDLKDTGALWSNAELDRCVRLAVADLSRFMPLDKVYEYTIDYDVDDEAFTSMAATSATALINGADIATKVDGDTVTITDQTPDKARPVKLTITDANASITAFTIIVKGLDEDNRYVEESFYFKDGLVQTGIKYFKFLTEVELDDIAGNGASDTLSLGTGVNTGVWQVLVSKPIEPESETVTSSPAGTTYTRDTDYEIDYINGRIRLISGGSMAASTAYLVDYTKSRLGINISAIIPELIRIQRVEYPVDSVPQKFASFSIWGNFMYVGSQQTNRSQERLTDKEHIAIYYERDQAPPSIYSPGSYPEFMDGTVALGARAYALLMKALQQEHQAVTDMATLRTTLGYIGIGGASPTLVMSSIATALVNVRKYLDNNTNNDAASLLEQITTDITSLRTAIVTAADAANAMLDKSTTIDIDAATPDSAVEALKKYEDKIDTLNIGSQVGQQGALYAQAWTTISQVRATIGNGYTNEIAGRIELLRTYIEQGGGFNAVANGFLSEAQVLLQEINSFLDEATRYADVVNGDLVMADRFRSEGLQRMAEFQSTLKSKSEWRRKVAIVPVHQPA